VTVEEVTDSMEFVLLATDGLWDVLEPQEAVNFVRRSLYDNGCLDRYGRVTQFINFKYMMSQYMLCLLVPGNACTNGAAYSRYCSEGAHSVF
jgi:serine/threonine protein phosphatase PrpC